MSLLFLPLWLAKRYISRLFLSLSLLFLPPRCNSSVHPFYDLHPFPFLARWLIYRGMLCDHPSERWGRFSGHGVLSLFASTNYIRGARSVGTELRGTAAALRGTDKLFTEGITRRTMMFALNDSGLDDNELCEIFIFPYRPGSTLPAHIEPCTQSVKKRSFNIFGSDNHGR